MKKGYLSVMFALFTTIMCAQAPEKLSYQAIIRNSNNQLIKNSTIGIRISIVSNNTYGNTVYAETQTPKTNNNGLITIEIGTGTVTKGSFATINWAGDKHFITTQIDPNGGTNYTLRNTTQLMSVPYALHAKTAERVTKTPNLSEVLNISNNAEDKQIKNVLNPTEKKDVVNKQYADIIATRLDSLITAIKGGSNNGGGGTTKTIQERLNAGETPYQIYQSNNKLLKEIYGKEYQGGIIFYLNINNGSGLIVAKNTLSDGNWSNTGTAIYTGANGTAIFEGEKNTNAIITAYGSGNYAAKECYDYVHEGYSDWYLPSKDELHELFKNYYKNRAGSMPNGFYWTSSESGAYNVWVEKFWNNISTQMLSTKLAGRKVQPIRKFTNNK